MDTLFVLSYNFYVRARVTPCSFLCRKLLGYILYGNTFACIRNVGLFCGVRQFDISDKTVIYAFYAETFKIVSNIIQYKIPFYLTFYVSIFKLFMKKRSTNKISGSDFDINRLINIFEDGETSEEYSKLLDYGIPITTITKISNNKISIENLKKRNYDSKIFDEYEKIIIEETINLL